ncbi:MerR family transcriptional regulator [Oceanirhabdus seepicola]|uniref:MerR family transcriptional regulator n=1 Tax=Oceanirhabdus seepicola TaxID=2828781 RepID=A0A9J6P565_9CLOT|nr:MerR family transcriptional regulator [Oceanirhabdus seepicola]MCM1991839.1 MerR family transcriptional regulator [Oceanirhabdus seepicola]
MEIGEFSKKTGTTIDTLRYYDKIKLLVPERINNRRRYTEEDIDKVIAILKLKKLNFSLEEIKALFELEKDINEEQGINNENKSKINGCLNIIEEKYREILERERDIIQIRCILEKMIHKTNKLLKSEKIISEEIK